MAVSAFSAKSTCALEELFPDVVASIVQRWGHAEFDPYILQLTDTNNDEQLRVCPKFVNDLALLRSIHRDTHPDLLFCNIDKINLPRFFV